MFPVNVHAWSPVLKNAAGRRRYLPMSALVPMASAARAKWSGCEATVVRTSFRKAEMTFAFKIFSVLYHDHNLHWFISLACHLVYIITTDMKWIHGSFSIHTSMQSKKTSRNDKPRRYGHLEMCVFWSCRIHLECMVTWCWSGTSAAEKTQQKSMGETSTYFLSLQLIYTGHLQFGFRNLSSHLVRRGCGKPSGSCLSSCSTWLCILPWTEYWRVCHWCNVAIYYPLLSFHFPSFTLPRIMSTTILSLVKS